MSLAFQPAQRALWRGRRPRLAASLLLLLAACTQQPDRVLSEPTLVELACGQCQFGIGDQGCDLALRLDGQACFVDGTDIDSLGDAHGADGLCNAVRHARVTGVLHAGRFQAQSVELLP